MWSGLPHLPLDEIEQFGEGLNPVTNPANQEGADSTPEAPADQEGGE